MSNWRPVDVRLWNDRKFLAGSDDARLLWLFLLTCPSLPIPGVVLGGDAALAEQLGWTTERLRERFQELSRNGLRVRRESRIAWLPNALKYQPPSNPNMVKGWGKKWDDVPEGELKSELWDALRIACKSWSVLFAKMFARPFHDGLLNRSGNGSGNGSAHDHQHDHQHDHETEKRGAPPAHLPRQRSRSTPEWTAAELASAARVIGRLREISGHDFQGAAPHVRLIIGRLREGIRESHLRAVIAYCHDEWKEKPEMLQYLRPKTLFGPEKIHDYLPHARARYAALIAQTDRELADLEPQPPLELVR